MGVLVDDAVGDMLAKTSRHTTVAVGVESVKIHANIAVVSAAALHGIQNGLHLAVHDLGSILAVGVDVHCFSVGFIICTLDITVAQGQLEVSGNLATPLAALAILLGGFDGLVDLGQSCLIGLRDDAGNGVLLVAAVDALGLPDIRKRNAATVTWCGA